MKWIALAILLVIVPYTFLTLHYRKPGPAFEPYADMKNRANTIRLLSAGFQRITLTAQRPADATRPGSGATISAALGGVPEALKSALVDEPILPNEITSVIAAASTAATAAGSFQFTCTLPDQKVQLSGAQLYVREGEIFIVPEFEKISGGLLARSRESVVLITVPAGALKPGAYRITLLGAHLSKAWALTVK